MLVLPRKVYRWGLKLAARGRRDKTNLWLTRGAYRGRTPLPAVVVIAMPKSGSIYLKNALQKVLKVPSVRFGGYGFTEPVVRPTSIPRMQLGFCVAKEYLPASDHVVATLRHAVPAVNVHVRDPRRALISWMGHLQERLDAGQTAEAWAFAERVLPDDYAPWSFAQRLGWHVEHVLPRLVAWIEGWVRVHDDPNEELEVVLSTFEELERDPAACIRSILERLKIPANSMFFERLPALHPKRHNVRGDPLVDRKTYYTPELWQRATALVPADLRARFNWE
jgi:hypothetical protein